ncbi:hypothetical protein [Streptomyces sp. NBC_01257]|uniref:hypothetical protein n=1 Tax=Streptomyces sp. NBC_01257 TaxID=2903799 RepID=UPI002DD9EC08|nr:hypothetical protein [Streptomyces sp. NBC_01257]WRZ67363.1 hypothetical protein OG408_27325 [Streptomyces sp. NBC_01257]
MGQGVKQGFVGGVGRGHRLVEAGQLFCEGLALPAEGGVLLPDGVPELLLLLFVECRTVPASTFGERADESGLALLDGGDRMGEVVAFLREAGAGVVGTWSGFEGRTEEGSTVGSEDVGGEEAGNGLEQDFFANPQALGVGGEPGTVTVLVGVRLAREVGDVVARLAMHPVAAHVAGDERPEDVRALGVGVAVAPGSAPRALIPA